ncbi:hypothetical protein [Agrobacterium tumefaciens]|uniref:hypothetical protein n=1 Tax=Agrobacterium tumefaciens TaxID=358 RepID=UPI001571FBDD|nr:hypothetical protein [Agrobacterium tumefaciens]
MTIWPSPPALDEIRKQQAEEDMASILRGEYAELPLSRLSILLDHELVTMVSPVMKAGCSSPGGTVIGLNWTEKGADFMGQTLPPYS